MSSSTLFFSSIKDKKFVKDLYNIAFPLFIANLVNNSLQIIDQLMLSHLGVATITAIGCANQIYFLFGVVYFGIASSAGIFFSRLWEQNNMERIKQIQVISLYIELIFSICVILIARFLSEPLMRLYSNDPEVIRIGTFFFTHMSYGQPFFALSCVLIYLFRISKNPAIGTQGTIIAVIVNTALNYILIYGHFSLPALGILGAVIATFVSRLLMFVYYIIMLSYKVNVLTLKLRNYFSISWPLARQIILISFSLVLGDLGIALSLNIYASVFSHFSTQTGAAYSITLILRQFSLLTINALTPSCMILIGYQMAKSYSSIQGIKNYALKIQGIGFYLSILIFISILIIEPLILRGGYSHIEPHIYHLAFKMVMIMCCFIPIINSNILFGGAIFRAGGATNINFMTVFVCNIVISYLCAIFTKMITQDPFMTYCSLFIGDIVRLIINILYFRYAKWVTAL